MKYILIAQSFQKQLKKLKRYLQEPDIVKDVKHFIHNGLGKGEAYLETHSIQTINFQVVKLRLCVYQVNFRYLIGVINDTEYLPIIIDLKKGKLGKNLSLKSDKKTMKAIKSAAINVISDYIEHTEETPKLNAYFVEDRLFH